MKAISEILKNFPLYKKYHERKYKIEVYDDNYTKYLPYFSVILFVGMVTYIAYDSLVGVYP